MKPPKFQTTIEGHGRVELGAMPKFPTYRSVDDVPLPVVQKIREIHLRGIPAQEIAELIEIPVEWVEFFLRQRPPENDNNPKS